MGDRHILAIDRICGMGAHRIRRQMGDDLVTVEVEVDPFLSASTFGTAEQISIEAARCGEVVDREGEMEGGASHSLHLSLLRFARNDRR
jgi:hypothetical protein